ncbi:MAG: putative zinc metalloprotease [Gemmatimonadota bacterium]|nr:MAG: putative zinc metalloprotease [Gemmatimonadota bacterium]
MGALHSMFFLALALSILVLVHEWGHYIVAVRSGVRVLKFSIGFGPELIGFTRGETRWSISAIPFGGFVRFAGDDPEGDNAGTKDEFLSASLGARTAIVLAGPLMNYALAILLFAGVLYFAGEPVPFSTRISEVVDGSIAESIGIVPDDEVRAVNGVPVETWVGFTKELHGIGADEEFALLVARGQETVELRGRAREDHGFGQGFPLGVLYFQDPVLGYVQRDGAAWNAGLRTGDRILSYAGKPAERWSGFATYVMEHPDEEIPITWEREGNELAAALVPIGLERTNEDGEPEMLGTIAAFPFVDTRKVGLGTALAGGWNDTWSLTARVLELLPRLPGLVATGVKGLVTGEREQDQGLGGPVRMAEMFGEAARWGLVAFLGMMASISTQLAIFNLLPIPVLDGGHLALHLVEFVTRRPPSMKIKIILHQIGFALLLLLMLSVTAMDVGRMLR